MNKIMRRIFLSETDLLILQREKQPVFVKTTIYDAFISCPAAPAKRRGLRLH